MTIRHKRQTRKVTRRAKRPYIAPPKKPEQVVYENFCNSVNIDEFFKNNPNVGSIDLMNGDRLLQTYINPDEIERVMSNIPYSESYYDRPN